MPVLRPILAAVLALTLSVAALRAQPLDVGSADDPLESQRTSYGRSTGVLAGYAGPSYLGSTWRTMAALDFEGRVGPFSVGVGGAVHSGDGGFYDPEVDELYDLARLVRYVRLDPRPERPLYARIGPTQRMRFGTGHLVRDYRSTTSWDERTVGAEAALRAGSNLLGAFTGDLRMNSVVGAYAELHPVGTLGVGLSAVHDLAPDGDVAPTAFAAEASLEAYRVFEFALSPFVSYAEYLNYGRSVGLGADFGAPSLSELATVNLRVGGFFNGDGFTPGYIGPFYAISNTTDRIISADSFFDEDPDVTTVGFPLSDIEGGFDLLTEFELVVLRTFEFYYHFRRHYGDQPLSDFSLRTAFRPRFVDGLRIELGIERQGLGSFFSLFKDLQDQNTLVFDIDYPVGDLLHLSIRSRYGYRLVQDGEGNGDQFVVQRRFEPLLGARLRF